MKGAGSFDYIPDSWITEFNYLAPVSYTHLRAHETVLEIVCRILLEKKNNHFILVL